MDKYLTSIIYGLLLGNAKFKNNNLIIEIDCIEVKSFLLKSLTEYNISFLIEGSSIKVKDSPEIRKIKNAFYNKSYKELPGKFYMSNITLAIWLMVYGRKIPRKNILTLLVAQFKNKDQVKLMKILKIIAGDTYVVYLDKGILSVSGKIYKNLSNTCRQTNIYFKTMEYKLCGL